MSSTTFGVSTQIAGTSKVLPTQYDSIGSTYTLITSLPDIRLATCNIREIVTPLLTSPSGSPVRVLDLACGTGYHTRNFLAWGADFAVGSDISTSMINTARSQSTHLQDKITYLVADASIPASSPETTMAGQTLPNGALFDVVTGIWCLNYASSSAHLKRFFTTISQNLKPGGVFIGVIPNIKAINLDLQDGVWSKYNDAGRVAKYGHSISKIYPLTEGEGAGEGLVGHVTAHVQPIPVEFDSYFLKPECFEKAAVESGVGKVEWVETKGPEEFTSEFEDLDEEFWSNFHLSSRSSMIYIRKE